MIPWINKNSARVAYVASSISIRHGNRIRKNIYRFLPVFAKKHINGLSWIIHNHPNSNRWFSRETKNNKKSRVIIASAASAISSSSPAIHGSRILYETIVVLWGFSRFSKGIVKTKEKVKNQALLENGALDKIHPQIVLVNLDWYIYIYL